jgi:hypothetical protein
MIVLLFAFILVTGIGSRIHQLVYTTSSSNNGGTIYNNYHYYANNNETAQTYSLWGKLISKSSGSREELQFDLASTDSFGFFHTISNTDWKQIQQQTKTSIELQFGVIQRTTELLLMNNGDNTSVNNVNNSTMMWWQENWNVNFDACSDNIVNIGGIHICDPLRILSLANEQKHYQEMKQRGWKKQQQEQQQSSPCIIYVSGGSIYNQFGEQLFHYLHDTPQQEVDGNNVPCEIHLFTTSNDDQSSIYNEAHDGVFIHPWGFHPSSSNNNNNNNKMDNTYKTLQDTITELNHSGRISLLALDCEGCEWEIYKDILSLSSSSLGGGGGGEPIIQHIVMQMHGAPNMANELFLAMQEAGYVIHNRVDVGDGHVWDYSWIRLSPSFFSWTQ